MEERASGSLNPSLKKGLRIPRTSKKKLVRIQEENRCHGGHHQGAPAPLVLKSNLYSRFWLRAEPLRFTIGHFLHFDTDRNPDIAGFRQARSGVFGQIGYALGGIVTIHKHLCRDYEDTIPQIHQFVNSSLVIFITIGVRIYNFFLFCPKSGGKCSKISNLR